MQWLRRHVRMGSWPALFALGLQIILSFGHIHADDLRPATATTFVAQHSDGGSGKPADDHDGLGRDFCAICAAVALTSSSVLPIAPLLAVPVGSYRVSVIDLRSSDYSFALRLNFQARGPPTLI